MSWINKDSIIDSGIILGGLIASAVIVKELGQLALTPILRIVRVKRRLINIGINMHQRSIRYPAYAILSTGRQHKHVMDFIHERINQLDMDDYAKETVEYIVSDAICCYIETGEY